jgi:hypothetical protein
MTCEAGTWDIRVNNADQVCSLEQRFLSDQYDFCVTFAIFLGKAVGQLSLLPHNCSFISMHVREAKQTF